MQNEKEIKEKNKMWKGTPGDHKGPPIRSFLELFRWSTPCGLRRRRQTSGKECTPHSPLQTEENTSEEPERPLQLDALQANASDGAQGSRQQADVVVFEDAAVQLGKRTIWRHANFQIAPGEFVAILGPNGAGKSTLLRLLLGLLRPSEGSVSVLGRVPRQGNAAIGYVPQRRLLDPDLPIRGRDLVMLGLNGLRWGFSLPGPTLRQQHARVTEALAAVEATTYADQPIGELSGGEQQRLFLAQALVGQPRLLLLDEPLASLDLRSQLGIAHLVAQLARQRGFTVLLVTHDVNPVLPVIDRVLYIARGQVAIGKCEEIITTQKLSSLYEAPVEVVRDSLGRIFVVGLEEVEGHPQ